MKKISPLLLVAGLFAQPVFAQNQPQGVAVMEKVPGAGAAAAEAVQLQGKVKSINKQGRSVVVVGPNGGEVLLTVGPEARNFDQIKVGDIVTLTMMHALAMELRKVSNSGIRERSESTKAAVAKAGEKPGVVVERTVHVVANVVGVNPKAQMLTLKGTKGTLELQVNDPAMFKDIKVGDQVEAVYKEAVALTVSPAGKK